MMFINRKGYSRYLFALLLFLVLEACAISVPVSAPKIQVSSTSTQAPEPSTVSSAASSTPSPTAASAQPNVEPASAFYNLPTATLTETTGLYASPNRGDLVVPIQIPAGSTIYVMGRNATKSHLRVVWNTGVGWVPVSFTSYNGDQTALGNLPVFHREPPPCALFITTQFSLDSVYRNDDPDKKRIVVVVDLFRSHYGPFPPSYLSLKVNGSQAQSTRREIVEQGQFSLKDIVFTVPGYIQSGDTIGYQLETSSDEPLAFTATLFNVPENCVWKTD